VEESIKKLFDNNDARDFIEDEYNSLKYMEGKNNDILAKEESEWRLKSRAIWQFKGDKNTKFFHRYAGHM